MGTAREVMEIEDVEWSDQRNPIMPFKNLLRRFLNDWIEVDRIDDVRLRERIDEATNRPEHLVHLLALVLTTVRCHQDQLPVPDRLEHRMDVIRLDGRLQSIDRRVSCDVDTGVTIFGCEIRCRLRCRSEM